MAINKVLSNIQVELKAPKNQYNNFGKYKYRSLEDILEGLKPLLKKYEASLRLNDEIIEIAGRIYVKAIATLSIDDDFIESVAYAREAEHKKGMDEAQVTGATSSYARKYALNGLFAIDDTKDADSMEHKEEVKKPVYTLSEDNIKKIKESKKTAQEIIKAIENKFILTKEDKEKILNLKK